MSYSNLEKDAAYAPGQSGESLVPPETTMGERFNLGWDRKALDSGFNAKQFNRDRIFPQLIDKALEDGDTEKAKAIADEANTLKIRNYEEMGMSSLNIFSNIANVVQSKFGDNTISPIEQEQIDQVNTEILALDKKIEKYDGFFNMITLGSMAKELTHPAILMSLPLSMYGATGRAAIGAGATNALRANASYTFARELGIAALSELYIQTQAYKYSQIREDEDRGIKAMTFTDVTANIAINSLFAASAAAGGSAIWDFGKIKFQGAKTFEKGESVEAFLRTRGQQGVDKVQLQKLLEETTFDNKVDPMVVAEIKRHIDTSPSADINLHTAQMTKAAHDLESKGYVDLDNDNISKNIDEANTNDFINVVDGDGNTLIGRVLHSTDKEVTIQYGDKEVKIDRETGEAIGEDLSAAPADPITTPEPQARNVNKVNTQQDTQEISPQQQQELITKYENDPDVIEASREIDESMAHFEDILGIEPEVVAKEVPEATPGETPKDFKDMTPEERKAQLEKSRQESEQSSKDLKETLENINTPKEQTKEELGETVMDAARQSGMSPMGIAVAKRSKEDAQQLTRKIKKQIYKTEDGKVDIQKAKEVEDTLDNNNLELDQPELDTKKLRFMTSGGYDEKLNKIYLTTDPTEFGDVVSPGRTVWHEMGHYGFMNGLSKEDRIAAAELYNKGHDQDLIVGKEGYSYPKGKFDDFDEYVAEMYSNYRNSIPYDEVYTDLFKKIDKKIDTQTVEDFLEKFNKEVIDKVEVDPKKLKTIDTMNKRLDKLIQEIIKEPNKNERIALKNKASTLKFEIDSKKTQAGMQKSKGADERQKLYSELDDQIAAAEAKATPEIKKYTIDNMDQHPRYNELLTMRQNATAYESKNPNNLVSKREYKTENTGKGYETEVIPAQHERNYNYDFQLSKQDVKSIINGKATDEVKQKAVDDLEFMDNSPEWQADQAQLDMEADILFSKAGPELLGGSVAGIEEDEDGNITIDPAAFVAGMLLGHTAKKLGSNPKVQKEVLQSLERIAEDIVKKYPMLNVVPQFAQELEALFLKDDKIVEATLMKDAKELPDPFTSKEAFSKGRSNKVKTPIGDVKVNLNKAYDHLTNNTHNKDRSNLSGAFFETLENPLFVVKKPYKDTENTIFYKPFKSKDGNKHIVSFTVDKKGELINKTFYDYNLEKLKKLIKVPDEDLVYLDKPSLKGSSKDANLYNGDPEIPEGSVSKDIIPQKAVKPPKELLVTHNLTEANLKFAEEKGGMIAPSIAITKADEILDGFGEITLIGDKGIVEPSSKTKTFGADIYSPRYPKVYSNTTVKQDRAIQQELDPYYQQVGETRELPTDGVSELYDNVAFKAKFLESKGIKPKIIKSKRVAKEVQDRTNKYFSDFVDLKSKDFVDAQQLRFNPEFQKQVLQELEDVDPGIVKALDMGDPIGVDASKELKRIAYKRASDIGRLKESVKKAGKIDPDETRYAIRDLINKKKLGQELTEYAQDFLRRQGAKEELYAGTDSQGRQKYKSHTVDNVLKAMKKDLRSGENFNYGVGSIRAKLTPEFKSIQQIINNKDRLVTKEIFDQSKEEITNKYQEIQESLKPYYEYDQNSFGYGDEVGYMLAEGATPKAMREYGFKDVPGYLQEEVDDLVNAMREMPTEYFETKILDQVDAGIFKAAVVPNGTSKETIQMLKDKGIKVTKYNTGEDGSRKAAVNKAAEKGKLLFMHPAATGGAIVATGMTAAEISNYKEQEL